MIHLNPHHAANPALHLPLCPLLLPGQTIAEQHLPEATHCSPSWKLEIFCHVVGKTIYPSFESGGGTADHLTGSLMTK